MPRRVGALALKELTHHGLVLLAVGAFLAFVWAMLLLGAAIGPRTITVLEAHADFVRIFLPLLGLALGRRLVVREYHGRTQRFLEALPVHRLEILVTKYGIGLALLGGVTFASLAVVGAVAALKEPVTGRWLLVILWRSEVFALALWSFFFAMGLLGRWRFPLYLGLFVLVVTLDRSTDVELARVGPFALVNETLPLERHDLPFHDLGVTLGLAAGLTAGAAALALVNEGSVAEAAAKTMSRREKAAVGVVFVAALIALDVADPRRTEAPFALEGEHVVRRPDARLAVLHHAPRHAPAAAALADVLAEDRRGLRDALGFGPLPPVHVVLRETLEPHVFERVALDDAEDGVLVRARFTDPAFDREAFRAFVLAEALDVATDGRASFEPHAWVRSGTAGWWVTRGGALPPAMAAQAASVARRRTPSWDTLARWQRTEERFGREATRAWSTAAARAAVEAVGEERWLAFARDVLEEDPPVGALAVIDARRRPVDARFEEATGLDVPAFERTWRDALRRRGIPGAYRLPRGEGFVRVEAEEGDLRVVRWGVRFARPPDDGALCALVHAAVGPFDRPIDPDETRRVEVPCAELDPAGERLVGRYGPGDRAFFAIEVGADATGAPIRLFSERRTIGGPR
ncbi:MAG TPA: ABC transporter permease [Sandaracinaceae bacterium LLY-WYZ-13_1]|nr:ABC transporter permease [Sandaracinaceae bacterium LLY-WYZ-13_1]